MTTPGGAFRGLLPAARRLAAHVTRIRRDIHKRPELGFNAHRTAGIIAAELNSLRLEVETGVPEAGVIATLSGRSWGRTVLFQADMDALPILERTGLPFQRRFLRHLTDRNDAGELTSLID